MGRTRNVDAVIAAAAESPYARHPATHATTETYLADAVVRVLAAAGVDRDEVDGLGVSSFTLAPDNAIDLAWKLGLRLRWLLQDTNGGASGVNMLRHAVRAVEAGDAEVVVLVAGDRLPDRRVLVEFSFPDEPPTNRRYWLLAEHGSAELCYSHPGGEPDVFVTARSEAFTQWHLGALAWRRAISNGSIQVTGLQRIARALPTWNSYPALATSGARQG